MNTKKIEEKYPLSSNFETDARDIWPKRWEDVSKENKKLKLENRELKSVIENFYYEIKSEIESLLDKDIDIRE